MKRQNKLVLLILAIILIFSSVLTACKEEELKELSPEDKKEREVVLEELREERDKIPEHVMFKEKYLDENDEIKGVVDYDYNDRGNITEANYYNDEGDLIERREYKYNDEGLLVEKKITDLEGTWRDYLWRNASKARIDFNNKWGVQEEILFELQEGLTATYEYNDNQQLVTYESRDDAGEKLRRIEIEYHPNYHKKLRTERRGDNYKSEYNYNQKGILEERIIETNNSTTVDAYHRNENNELIKVKTIEEDNDGNLIEERITNSKYKNGGKIVHSITTGESYWGNRKSNIYSNRIYEYDEKGNTKRIIRKEEEGVIDEIEKSYWDEKGNLAISMSKDEEGNIISKSVYEREYDEYGNTISLIVKSRRGRVLRNKRYYYKKIK